MLIRGFATVSRPQAPLSSDANGSVLLIEHPTTASETSVTRIRGFFASVGSVAADEYLTIEFLPNLPDPADPRSLVPGAELAWVAFVQNGVPTGFNFGDKPIMMLGPKSVANKHVRIMFGNQPVSPDVYYISAAVGFF